LRTDIADARDDDAAAVCRVIVIVIVEVGAVALPVLPELDPFVEVEGATCAPPEQPAIAINAATAAKRSVLN
jgi:hypothetical protein